MSDDSILTARLRKLADTAGNEPGTETIVLDEMDLMATTEFKRLLYPASEQDDDSE